MTDITQEQLERFKQTYPERYAQLVAQANQKAQSPRKGTEDKSNRLASSHLGYECHEFKRDDTAQNEKDDEAGQHESPIQP